MRKLILVALMLLTCSMSYALTSSTTIDAVDYTNSVNVTLTGIDNTDDYVGLYAADTARLVSLTNSGYVQMTRDEFDGGSGLYLYGLMFNSASAVTLTNSGTISLTNDYTDIRCRRCRRLSRRYFRQNFCRLTH